MSAEGSALRRLADACGIVPAYLDVDRVRHEVDDDTRVAVLGAMGLEAGTERAAADTLAALERRRQERLLAPSRVVRRGDWARRPSVSLALGGLPSGALDVEGEIVSAVGERRAVAGRVRGRGGASASFALPGDLPQGDHRVTLRVRGSTGVSRDGTLRLAIVPDRAFAVEEALGAPPRAVGLWTNLYTLRSDESWGHGTVGDLARLARGFAELGADFVGLNPLHACRNRGLGVSPYQPLTRKYRNELYLDVTAVPELATCVGARAALASSGVAAVLAQLRQGDRIEHERVLTLKRGVLRPLHRAFRSDGAVSAARREAHRAYLAREGRALEDFATFVALLERDGVVPPRDDPAVARARVELADEIAFHAWVQFELDRQLGEAQGAARAAGMRLGLYQDLALGSASDGADVWARPGGYARGVTVGAPPDGYNPRGQDWGMHPELPSAMAEDGFAEHRAVLRAALAHAGAVRIDHVMGFERRFWIPAGAPPSAGAYVRYPFDSLLGLVAAESRRERAVVVGEDLGTVPQGFGARLARWGILSSRLLYFERERSGAYRPAARYSRRALVTANTHDLPPIRGFVAGTDLRMRRAVGAIATDAELEAELDARAHDVAALERRVARDVPEAAPGLPVESVHAFLARTPAPLVGASLDDLAGEAEPVNLPGVDQRTHPSWSRRMTRTIEDLVSSEDVARAMQALDPPAR